MRYLFFLIIFANCLLISWSHAQVTELEIMWVISEGGVEGCPNELLDASISFHLGVRGPFGNLLHDAVAFFNELANGDENMWACFGPSFILLIPLCSLFVPLNAGIQRAFNSRCCSS